jgi:hypothetical protein
VVITWGIAELVGVVWGTAEVDEAHDHEAAMGQAVGPLRVVVGQPVSVP